MSVWENYYKVESNRRRFPDEDVARFLSMVANTIEPMTKLSVLDVGCGDFRNGQAVKSWFPQAFLVGIDFLIDEDLFSQRGTYDAVIPCPWEEYFALNVVDQDILVKYGCNWLPRKNFYDHDIILDCMTSQHFSWKEHESYFKKIYLFLKPGGWFFLKHLNWKCSDTALAEPIDQEKFTYRNVPNVPGSCYPGNGLVCMPSAMALGCLLADVGFQIEKAYFVTRTEEGEERDKVFDHLVVFCRKPK